MIFASSMAAAGLTFLGAPAASATPTLATTTVSAEAHHCTPKHHGPRWRWHGHNHKHGHWDRKIERHWSHTKDTHYCQEK